MKLVTFYENGNLNLGVKKEDGIFDLTNAAKAMNIEIPQSINEVILEGEGARKKIDQIINECNDQKYLFVEGDIELGPCISNPGKIICVGLNYKKHAEETNAPIPEYPILFNKFSNTIAAHNDEIVLPFNSNQVDYEAELVIVIGREAKRVSKENALDYVFGYCNVNDLSARDLQLRTSQWMLGKCCDGFSPVGPYLVTKDEIGNPNNLEIRTLVNGEVRQQSNTSDMIFSCAEIISYISDYMTLEPGDMILTGTPEGVILGYPTDQRVWLKEGDVVEIEIEGLGKLKNKIIQE